MKTSAGISAAIALLSAASVQAQIAIGTSSFKMVVAWDWGDGNVCEDQVPICQVPENPCGHEFPYQGKSGYTLEGCGTPTMWVNHGGGYACACETYSDEIGCKAFDETLAVSYLCC